MSADLVGASRETAPFNRLLLALAIVAGLGLGLAVAALISVAQLQRAALDTATGQLLFSELESRRYLLAQEAVGIADRIDLPALSGAADDTLEAVAQRSSFEGMLLLLRPDGLALATAGAALTVPGATDPASWPGVAALVDQALLRAGASSGLVGSPTAPALAAVASLPRAAATVAPGDQPAALLLVVEPLTPALLRDIASAQEGAVLRLEPPAARDDGRQQALDLVTRDGTVLGRLRWAAGDPLGRLLDWALPLMAVAILLVAVLGMAVTRRMRGALSRASDAERRAERDALTGLGNRDFIRRHLAALVAQDDGRAGDVAVLYIDLDGFKQVNDTRGHAAGDRLLAAVGGRLSRALRKGDAIARVGGDEFLLVQVAPGQPGTALLLCRRLLTLLGQPFGRSGVPMRIDASIGVAVRRPGDSVEALIERADAALYRAKASGSSSYCLSGSEPVPFHRLRDETRRLPPHGTG